MYNIWCTDDNGKTYYAPNGCNPFTGDNKKTSIAECQTFVEQLVGLELDWMTPLSSESTTQEALYDSTHGYRRHRVAYHSPPDSFAVLDGTQYRIKQVSPTPPIEKELPTLDALYYALRKGDSRWSRDGILIEIKRRES